GKKPSENKEYIVIYSDDGTITLVPKIEDPFSGGEEAEYYEKDEWEDLSPEGREIL
ncbi:AbrB family transcriptional regulator, partial [Enterococcus faecium]|nr:AbrB family transcriptional regulator [Enterococcus faecium]